MSGINPLEMKDEDFLNLSSPPVVESEPVQETEPVVVVPPAEVTNEEVTPAVVEPEEVEAIAEEPIIEGSPAAKVDEPVIPEAKPAAEVPQEPKPTGSTEGQGAVETGKETETVDYEKSYKDLLAPIKANGKELTDLSPAEFRQLAQMGANYTQKMQAIAPHRKMLTMAQNHGIDEDKLSFLIDLDKGNPEAIQKFLKDKGVDPLSIDLESEANYREGTHKVDDKEVAFRAVLDEVISTPTGVELLTHVNDTWDDASKEKLMDDPKLLSAIQSQKENGIYDTINAEMDRMKMLGTILPQTSYLDAYRMAGDKLMEAGAFNHLAPKQPEEVVPPKVVEPLAVKPAAPAVEVDNSEKVRAAAPSPTGTKTAKTTINPLELSDEAFMAHMNQLKGRV